MKMFYSPSLNGMFNDAVYGKSVPEDAVLIPKGRVDEILDGLGMQQTLVIGNDGSLKLVDPMPVEPTTEQQAAVERAWRDSELSRTEWLVARHRDEIEIELPTTVPTEQYTELLAWRQLLRDWPTSEAFPAIANRPSKPGWLTTQTH